MKRKLVVILTIVCLTLLISSFASAGPAPQLSRVHIDYMGPDSLGNWVELSGAHTLKGPVSKSGYNGNFYMQVTSTGMYNGVYIYRDGGLIPSSKIRNYAHNAITSGGIVVGYTDCYEIPFSALGVISVPITMSQISIREMSVNGGPTLEDYVNNIKVQP